MKPLAGKTVLLTRPRESTDLLAKKLKRLSARVISAPAIRIAPPLSWRSLERGLRDLKFYDRVIFTSVNGVETFFQRSNRLNLSLTRPRRLYAIGPATRRALAERGWKGALTAPVHEGKFLAKFMGPVRGSRVLLIRATIGGEDLPRILRKSGARVDIAFAYRTLPDAAGLKRLNYALKEGTADWIVFASASAVNHAVKSSGNEFSSVKIASIGPVTTAALNKNNLRPLVEAYPYTGEGLVKALLKESTICRLEDLQSTLLKALRQSGKILRDNFGKVRIHYKGLANIVTAADKASEKKILETILDRFPNHDYLAEESASRIRGSDYLWIIDPLDGTTNYAHGYPACCVSIGLIYRKKPLLGGVYDPFRDELFLAARGRGTTLNGKPLSVSRVGKVGESLLLTGFPYDRAKKARYYLKFYERFMQRCHDVRRSGSAALDLAWTAAGRVDGYWEFNLAPWDVAAGMLLVEEAGGKVTDFSGNILNDPKTFGRQTLATNGKIHSEMLGLIKEGVRP